MNYQYDDEDPSKEEWKRQLLESRQVVRDALSECAGSRIDNWNPVNVPELVQFLHARTIDYYRHIRPKREGLRDGKWEEELVTVRVPKSQSIDGGMTDWYGDYDIPNVLDHAEWEQRPVCLDTLPEYWLQNNLITITARVTTRATGDTVEETERYQLHLPPAACEAVIARLDDCLEDLGWLPEAAEINIGSDDVEPLKH